MSAISKIQAEADPFRLLEQWYRANCDGDWEHQHGVRIGTIDNPGWSIDVDLEGTALAGIFLEPRLVEHSDDDWVFVEAKDDVFRARGGPGNLIALVAAFVEFAGCGRMPVPPSSNP